MKISFVLPSFNLSGGLRVISKYAELLANKGHEVTVIGPNYYKESIFDVFFKKILPARFNKNNYCLTESTFSLTYFSSDVYDINILDKCRKVKKTDVPDSDIIIATFWTTVEWIKNFDHKKGKKVYFIQGFDAIDDYYRTRVINSYKAIDNKIVVSEWLKRKIEHEISSNVDACVPNGVDTKQFFYKKRSKNVDVTFGHLYSPYSFKGSNLTIHAFKTLKKEYPNVKLIMFGNSKPKYLDSSIIFFENPTQDKLKKIYGRCDAWIFSSLQEGFGLPILESMACRTPVIAFKTGAAPDIVNSRNGILLENKTIDEIVHGMNTIINMNNHEWEKLSEGAYETAQKFTWEKSAHKLEKVLIDIRNL